MKHWPEGHCTYLHVKTTTTGSGRYLCAHRWTKPSGENVSCWKMLCVPPKSFLPIKTHVASLKKEGMISSDS